jgi:hypothetical protein
MCQLTSLLKQELSKERDHLVRWIFHVFLIISCLETLCFSMGNKNLTFQAWGQTQRFLDLSGAGSAGIFIIHSQVTARLPM